MRFECLAALAAASVLSACHTFQPMSVESVALGSRVRARVSGSEADRLSEPLGKDAPRVVEGVLVGRNERAVTIEVPTTTRQEGFRFQTLRQRVDVRREEILELETKDLDGTATGALVAAGAAVGVGIVIALIEGEPGERTEIPPGGPSEGITPRILPGIRIPFP